MIAAASLGADAWHSRLALPLGTFAWHCRLALPLGRGCRAGWLSLAADACADRRASADVTAASQSGERCARPSGDPLDGQVPRPAPLWCARRGVAAGGCRTVKGERDFELAAVSSRPQVTLAPAGLGARGTHGRGASGGCHSRPRSLRGLSLTAAEPPGPPIRVHGSGIAEDSPGNAFEQVRVLCVTPDPRTVALLQTAVWCRATSRSSSAS